MASKEQSFSSNNPFRRKLGNNTPTVRTESPAPTPAPASTLDGAFDSTPRPPFTTFKSVQPQDERYDPNPDEEAASAQLKPKKVVKKVRVQSPPPSSPEDAVPVTRFPPLDDDDDYDDENEDENDDDDDDEDTDDGDSSDSRDYGENRRRLKGSLFAIHDGDSFEHTQTGPPANPFSKTLQDLEQTGKGQDTNTSAAKGNLDVNSFKRLLLTGHANIPGPLSTLPTASKGSSGGPVRLHPSIQDGASNTDASSVSRQSIFDAALQETPRTSHETSEPEDPDERKGLLSPPPISSGPSARKKPPPPSSRHGKLIKIELKADAESRAAKDSTPVSINTTSLPITAPPRQSSSQSITPLHSPFLPRDVNKPLPQTPFRPSVEEAVDSPFDREAIGKVPEPFADIQANPRSPTPPVATRNRSESNSSIQSRKPAAPPPRRHGRNDSKVLSIIPTNADDDTPPRSSLESTRSRPESIRINSSAGINIPAPPPPRRPNHARQGSSFTSPSQASFAPMSPAGLSVSESDRSPPGTSASNSGHMESLSGLATITTSRDGLPKLSPPPPPPARTASTRRPPSVRSVDLGSGSTARKVSREKEGGVAPPPPPPPRQRGSSRASVEAPAAEGTRSPSGRGTATPAQGTGGNNKQGQEILNDLDTLQKEVNALMGRYGNAGGS